MSFKLSHKRIIHFCDLEDAYAKAHLGCGTVQPFEQDEYNMKLMKLSLPMIGALSLAACVDAGGGGSVTRAATPAASCGYLQGLSPQHIDMIGSTRCGPQTELPYTFAN